MRLSAARLPALATAAVLAIVMSGCAQPEYRYVANSDRDLVLRVPRTWAPISTDAVLGPPSATQSAPSGWLVFYDGARTPSAAHVKADSANSPVMWARSVDVAEADRPTITTDYLLNFFLPVTKAARDADDLSRASAGQAPQEFTMITNEIVKTKTAQGVHVVFSYQSGTSTEYYDEMTVTNPKKTRLHFVMVHCNQACYDASKGQIDDAVDSLTVKTK